MKFSIFLLIFCGVNVCVNLLEAAENQGVHPLYASSRVDTAVAAGIRYLQKNQNQEGFVQDPKLGSNKIAATTGLTVMAFAAVGHQPADRTPEGRAMSRAISFLLAPERLERAGYFGAQDASRMYGHGIVALALTEMLGMGASKAQDALIRDRSIRSIQVILAAQKVQKEHPRFIGGWRYYPDARDSDLSITVWQLMALRSAKNAGLGVPKQAIDAAYTYLWRSFYSKRDASGNPVTPISGFGYMPGSPPKYATTAAGMLAMQVIGGHNRPEVRGAAEWLMRHNVSPQTAYFYYGTYYYAQAMKKQGGKYAEHGKKVVENILLNSQDARDGFWSSTSNEDGHGRVYATALAILSLSVKHGFLPIYQD
jgi:hypothetical protein